MWGMQIMDQILFKNKLLDFGTQGQRYGDIYVLPREQELPVNVISFGIDYCQEYYRNVRLNSYVSVLAYVLSGQGNIHIGSETYTCQPGDVYILRKGTQHEIAVGDSVQEFSYLWYNLAGNSLSLLDSFRVPFPLHIPKANVEDLFRKGIQVIGQAKQLESVQIPVMLVCTEILMTLNKLLIQRNSKLSDQVLKFMTYLDTIGFEPFHSTMMSEFFNMSIRHINRIFKAETGTTLYQYVLMRKVDTAKVLLKDTSISIREIAEQLGFTDQYHFSNYFKQRTGTSPTEYRKHEH
jgi:AraC family transcriptional regulator of arabinose operon